MWLPLYGILSSLDLVRLGLCLKELSTCLPVGGILEGRRVLRFGRWCQYSFFGVFGRKEILGVSRMGKVFHGGYFSFFFFFFFHTLYLWTVAFLSPLSLSFVDFLACISLPN
jgi:hypothetical protein